MLRKAETLEEQCCLVLSITSLEHPPKGGLAYSTAWFCRPRHWSAPPKVVWPHESRFGGA